MQTIGLKERTIFHELSYCKITLDDGQIYYVAIETIPLKIKYFIAKTTQDLDIMIKDKYQCTKIHVIKKCDQLWYYLEDTPERNEFMQKYLKYKQKYLKYKQKLNLISKY
jgi:hypothetical protein